MGLNDDRGFNNRGPYFPGGGGGAGGLDPGSVLAGLNQRAFGRQQNDFQRGVLGQQLGAQSSMLDRQLAQQNQESLRQYQAQMAGYGNQKDIAGIQARAAELPAQLQQGRFDKLFPLLSGQLGQLGSWQSGYAGAGPQGAQPQIGAGPVYSEGQVQQQVNAQRAANDAGTAGKVRQMQGELAGRGFGSRSPLAMMLQQGYQGQNLQANTANEQQTRWNAASGNAQQLLAAQQAQENQYASRQEEDIKRNQVRLGSMNALLGALAGMV